MQGVVLVYDPQTGEGVVVSDATGRVPYPLAPNALEHSIFRTLRQGQRVVFDLDDSTLAVNVRTGAEADLGGPTARV